MIGLTDKAEKLGLNLDINKLIFDSNRDVEITYHVDFNNISDKVEQLLNNEIINLDDANAVGYKNGSTVVPVK